MISIINVLDKNKQIMKSTKILNFKNKINYKQTLITRLKINIKFRKKVVLPLI